MENELTEQKQGFLKNFISDWKGVFVKPKDFFAATTMEYGKALKFAGINILIYSIGTAFITQTLRKTLFFNPLLLFVYIFISTFLGLFILSFIMHCFFKIFGGKGSYKESLGVRAYSLAISIFSWIPIVGIIAEIYGLYITVRGGEVKHNLSAGKSVAAVVISLLLPLLLVFAIFATTLGMLRR
ncbi:YIP1 family protein [Candidatus Babeliales bacterium]|nr:YIP1 family protein [Candidatus Babeliales bacterium]